MRIVISIAMALALLILPLETRNGIYLDKLDSYLDSWWNKLDEICRGSHDEDQIDLACKQRLELDTLIEKRGSQWP
jgi:hypothetical protein